MVKLINTIRLQGSLGFRTYSSSVFPKKPQPQKVNDLTLPKGEFKDFSLVRLDEKMEWKSSFWSQGFLGSINDSKIIKFNLHKILSKFNPLQSYSMLLMVRTSYGFLTISKQVLLNHDTNVDELHDYIQDKIEVLAMKYKIYVSDLICYKYRALYVKVKDSSLKEKKLFESSKLIKSKYLNSKYIPYTMDLSNYGVLIGRVGDSSCYQYNNLTKLIVKVVNDKHHIVEVYNLKDDLILSFIDKGYDSYFIRECGNISLKFDYKYNILLIENELNVNFIQPIPMASNRIRKYLTFDIETFKDKDNNFIPYSCGFYDGKSFFNYYLTDYNSPEDMLLTCLRDMMKPEYNSFTVYTHNFAKFDCLFLFNLLHKNFKTKFISKDNQIISLTIKNDDKICLKFKDSLKILVNSLESLGKSFDVPVKKDIFPYSFVKRDKLNYVGKLPSQRYYKNLSDYNLQLEKFKNKDWSLRDETIKYLNYDLISLFLILQEMNDWLYDVFKINMTNYSTVSGISFAIYRSNYLKKDYKLPRLKGEILKNIRDAYYGGGVDVYKPYGRDLYYYDVNSLYPYSMLKDMPVGNPIQTSNSNLNEIFGFVKATVTSPPNIKKPILPFKSDKGLIFPTGTWTSWYFSEELKQARDEFGYKIVVHHSYIFQRNNKIFTEFIKEIGVIKEYSKGASKEIAKLLLNSLYGRMGMNDNLNETKIVSNIEAQEIHMAYQVIDNYPLDDNMEYISYKRNPDISLCMQTGVNFIDLEMKRDHQNKEINSAPGIAAAITAYSRMYMNKLKNIPGNECFYSDTDSVILQNPLTNYAIDNKIGNLKLEYPKIKEGYFLAPKLYLLELENGSHIAKGRGYSGKLSKMDYMKLYNEENIKIIDRRWKRRLNINTITEVSYHINFSPTLNKRVKLYSQGKWVDTQPLRVQEDKILENLAIVPTKSKKP